MKHKIVLKVNGLEVAEFVFEGSDYDDLVKLWNLFRDNVTVLSGHKIEMTSYENANWRKINSLEFPRK